MKTPSPWPGFFLLLETLYGAVATIFPIAALAYLILKTLFEP